jgi:hypothetical protein
MIFIILNFLLENKMFFECGCDTYFKNGQFEDTSQCSLQPTPFITLFMAFSLGALIYHILTNVLNTDVLDSSNTSSDVLDSSNNQTESKDELYKRRKQLRAEINCNVTAFAERHGWDVIRCPCKIYVNMNGALVKTIYDPDDDVPSPFPEPVISMYVVEENGEQVIRNPRV